ncbi:hypothetical protein AX17_006912 [Amanita inopinata Kibby_2008]|nr:hypothetical protein AX17_006912 [Amanita inopinata Kibby_2008]
MSLKPCSAKQPSQLWSTIPTELHLHIQKEVTSFCAAQLLGDPDTTMADYKPLRLVCRLYDVIWSPIVLRHILVFRKNHNVLDDLTSDPRFQQLLDLLHKPERLCYTETITIDSWLWMESDGFKFFFPVFETFLLFPPFGVILALMNMTVTIPYRLIQFALKPTFAADLLNRALSRFRAKSHLAQLSEQPNFPNVRCVRWVTDETKKRSMVTRMLKIFMSLPNLTELELTITQNDDCDSVATHLAQLHNLRKLSLCVIELALMSRFAIARPPFTRSEGS